MKTFMLGWEFPPAISGGLGTACYGLTKAMARLGVTITFVLPRAASIDPDGDIKKLSAQGSIDIRQLGELGHITFRPIPSALKPYAAAREQKSPQHTGSSRLVRAWQHAAMPLEDNYGNDIVEEALQYAAKAAEIATLEEFDVIHAHDWMTFPAGLAVAKATGRPLVVHIHSTEFDRSGERVNQAIYDIEREGMHAANKVIAVSKYTKSIIINRYAVPPEKVEVVYNAVDAEGSEDSTFEQAPSQKTDRIVLFLGRITMQKGPEFFLDAAKKVLEKIQDVKFVMAGSGDMMHRTIELAARMGIADKVLFTGFLQKAEVDRMYQMADLYVMPSVSEPFGITPLEALNHNVPVLVSRQSGVAEVLTHALKVDFWDINQMANKIVAVLKYAALQQTLRENGRREVSKFRWDDSAAKVIAIYEQVTSSLAALV